MNIRKLTKKTLLAPVDVAKVAWDALDEGVNGEKKPKKA